MIFAKPAKTASGGRVGAWFTRTIVDTGRLPLFCFFVGIVVGFGFIRFSVRMIRAQVKWWPGNVTPGGDAHPPRGVRRRLHADRRRRRAGDSRRPDRLAVGRRGAVRDRRRPRARRVRTDPAPGRRLLVGKGPHIDRRHFRRRRLLRSAAAGHPTDRDRRLPHRPRRARPARPPGSSAASAPRSTSSCAASR